MKRLFPLFLKLEKRKCLIVGAGKIGESKAASLLETGAILHVVAPRATPRIKAWAREGRLRWRKRKFVETDLTGCFLVIAATSSAKLHERIFQLAKKREILCNVVDVPELCDFYYPAVVQRGSLQIAVSTAGESPALAQRLRKELEAQFGREYEKWLQQLGQERRRILSKGPKTAKQKTQLHQMVSEGSFRKFLAGRSK
jgi:precorrin-2 dehydrogenase / sirohydrochlorin ferrochelatase